MRRVPLCAIAACALGAALVAACASLSGLDDGPPAPKAGATDVRTITFDAGSGDVGVRRDAGEHDTAPDADTSSARKDSGSDVAHDARVDVACTPFMPGDAANFACAPVDAAARAPQPLTGFVASFIPPVTPSPVCTRKQISTLVDTCFSASQNATACDALLSSAPLAACNACVITGSNASAWGALIYHEASGFYIPNVGGCIAITAPCQRQCALAIEEYQECSFAACEVACVSDVGQFNTCTATAGGCECRSVEQARLACEGAMPTGPDSLCYDDATNFVQAAVDFGNLLCGGAPEDAGPG